jgi:hypothetical protein
MKIVLQILTSLPLSNRDDGKRVISLWQKYLPNLLPDKYGNWEPIDRPFNPVNLDGPLDAWKWPFLAAKNTPSVEVAIWMRKGQQPLHATWTLSLDVGSATQTELTEFLKAAAVELRADFACLHLLTPAELERGRGEKVVLALDKKATRFTFLIGSKDLQERVPDLFWTTIFGAPYLDMLGRDRLLSAPVHIAQQISSKAVLLQLTKNLTDVEKHSTNFDEIRSEAMSHLGNDVFFQLGHAGNYRAPQFNFV